MNAFISIEYMMYFLHLCLWCSVFISFFFIIQTLPAKTRRWKRVEWPRKTKSFFTKWILMTTNNERIQRYERLLWGCGWRIDALDYLILKRFIMGMMVVGVFVMYLFRHPVYSTLIIAILIMGILIGCLDQMIFDASRRKRRNRIVREIYILSNQLLYYQGSNMNLHTKLMNCIPFTKTIRTEMHLLTNEWYEDPAAAIRRFKYRLGTDEGYSFAETLNSLRLYDSDHYYDLLRQRIRDYKEKLELLNESRKETNSYILFVLAGIPILNTFRVFIYPWVQEGRKLFESLN